jgi:UDP-N-acetylglucosamine:LPS N-acetylglucosamine transferase
LFEQYDTAFVTIHDDYKIDVPGHRFYVVSDITRVSLPRLFVLVPQLVKILLKEKPDVIITTGSAPALICLAVARVITRAKTIWIDSIANCEGVSTSGSQAKHVAHLWLTQWPDQATPKGPAYWGAVL